ncbi:MAG: (deoxy)nucleoside triphosphate pyrophosphohydrolase [Limisphaerales bacterium]
MNVIEVSAGLIFRDGLLLITQRRPNDPLGGLWEFPGGKREANETFQECLRRELREELGIEVTVGECIESVSHNYPEKSVHLKFFQCVWVRNEPQKILCNDFAWITKEQILHYSFPPADARLLEKLCEGRKFFSFDPLEAG